MAFCIQGVGHTELILTKWPERKVEQLKVLTVADMTLNQAQTVFSCECCLFLEYIISVNKTVQAEDVDFVKARAGEKIESRRQMSNEAATEASTGVHISGV